MQNNRSSRRRSDLASSMPSLAGVVSGSDIDDLRRTLENDNTDESGKSNGAPAEVNRRRQRRATVCAGSAGEESLDERIRRKIEQENSGQAAKSNERNESKEKTSTSRRTSRRPTGLSSSMVERCSDESKDKLSSDVKSRLDKFEGRIRRMSMINQNQGAAINTFNEPANREVESESFDQRLQRKLEIEKLEQSQGDTEEGIPTRPKPPADSAEVDSIREKLSRKRNSRIRRPYGLSSSLPPDSVHNFEGLEQDDGYNEDKKVDQDGMLQYKNEADLSLDEKIKLKKIRKSAMRLPKETNDATKCEVESWACASCTFVNESVGIDVSLTKCKMCEQPYPKSTVNLLSNKRNSMAKQGSFKLEGLREDAPLQKTEVESWSELGHLETSKTDSTHGSNKFGSMGGMGSMLDSWSELGDILELTKQESALEQNAAISSKPKSKPLSRRASDAECWVCMSCANRNLDPRSMFCGTCGESRF